jgi:hypothetical protein
MAKKQDKDFADALVLQVRRKMVKQLKDFKQPEYRQKNTDNTVIQAISKIRGASEANGRQVSPSASSKKKNIL